MATISVIGAGSWGTALAQAVAENDNEVRLWARRPEVADAINRNHRNPRYLSDVELSSNVRATCKLEECLQGSDAALIVTPSHLLREMALQMNSLVDPKLPVAVCCKGIEEGTGALPLQVLTETLGSLERFAVISGPNHAEEVVEGVPSATVAASCVAATADRFQGLLAGPALRVYASLDPVGVEVCAAYKNIIAIAVGLSYGLGFGDNTAATIITRGLAEMSRLVTAAGGDAMTCMGLAGAGDAVVTCMSRHSRNRRFGQDYLALGKTLEDFSHDTHMVVEGAAACKNVAVLEHRYQLDLPLCDGVRAIAWDGVNPRDVVRLLIDRPLKSEF